MSTTNVPARRPCTALGSSGLNSTSFTTPPCSSIVMTRSAWATAAAGVSATVAPASASASALARVRFHTVKG